MSTTRIARRYAKPLIELAIENNVLDKVKGDMENFTSLCKENRQFVAMLKSPILSSFKKADILRKIFEGKVEKITMSAIDLITKKSRESFLPNVAEQFMLMYNDKQGIQKATVTTTFPLDKKLQSEFEKTVKALSGKKPLLEEKIDENIIGGYILKLDDKQLDESVSSQLSELRLKFKKEKK